VTITPAPARRPLRGCPAISGQGTEISAASFTLVAEDCEPGPGGQPAETDVFGFWQVPGQDSDDLIHADGFTVPAWSPVAEIAHKVARSRRRTRITGELLRARITACPCVRTAECPAFDDIAMLEAIEQAARRPAVPGWPRPTWLRRRPRRQPQPTGECP
jgi:hypothetical protein